MTWVLLWSHLLLIPFTQPHSSHTDLLTFPQIGTACFYARVFELLSLTELLFPQMVFQAPSPQYFPLCASVSSLAHWQTWDNSTTQVIYTGETILAAEKSHHVYYSKILFSVLKWVLEMLTHTSLHVIFLIFNLIYFNCCIVFNRKDA